MNHEVSVSVALFLQDENVPLLISTAIAYDVSTPRVHAKSVTRQRVFVESPLFFFWGGGWDTETMVLSKGFLYNS